MAVFMSSNDILSLPRDIPMWLALLWSSSDTFLSCRHVIIMSTCQGMRHLRHNFLTKKITLKKHKLKIAKDESGSPNRKKNSRQILCLRLSVWLDRPWPSLRTCPRGLLSQSLCYSVMTSLTMYIYNDMPLNFRGVSS